MYATERHRSEYHPKLWDLFRVYQAEILKRGKVSYPVAWLLHYSSKSTGAPANNELFNIITDFNQCITSTKRSLE
jgi:hypothetical protein